MILICSIASLGIRFTIEKDLTEHTNGNLMTWDKLKSLAFKLDDEIVNEKIVQRAMIINNTIKKV